MSQVQKTYPTLWKEILKGTIKEHEGFSNDVYLDDRGNETVGYGQTGEYANMPFPKVFDIFLKKAQRLTPGFDELPLETQMAVLSATYRGDWGQSLKTRELFNGGLYEEAAKEFLNNDDYRRRKSQGEDGVTKRMEWIAQVIGETQNG